MHFLPEKNSILSLPENIKAAPLAMLSIAFFASSSAYSDENSSSAQAIEHCERNLLLFLLILLSGGAGALLTDSVTVIQKYMEGKRKDS